MANRIVLLACGSFNPITNMHLRLFEVARDALSKKGYEVVAGVISPVSDSYAKQDLVPAHHRCAMIELALQSADWISLDRWESEQKQWTETVKILRRQREIFKSTMSNNVASNEQNLSSKRKRKLSDTSVDNSDNLVDNQLAEPDNQPSPAVRLLCGADLLQSFCVPGLWKDADKEEIVSQFGIVCISRLGFDIEKFIYENDMLNKYRCSALHALAYFAAVECCTEYERCIDQENICIVTEHIYNEISATKIRRALRRRESVKYLAQDSVIDYIHKHRLYEDTKQTRRVDRRLVRSSTVNDGVGLKQSTDSGLPTPDCSRDISPQTAVDPSTSGDSFDVIRDVIAKAKDVSLMTTSSSSSGHVRASSANGYESRSQGHHAPSMSADWSDRMRHHNVTYDDDVNMSIISNRSTSSALRPRRWSRACNYDEELRYRRDAGDQSRKSIATTPPMFSPSSSYSRSKAMGVAVGCQSSPEHSHKCCQLTNLLRTLRLTPPTTA